MPSVADRQEASPSSSRRQRATAVGAQAQPIHESQQLPHTIDGRSHIALLPVRLWDTLLSVSDSADASSSSSPSSSRAPQAAVVAVQFPEVHRAGRRRGATETQADRIFLYSAYRSEEAEDHQTQTLSLSWLPELYESSPVSVRVAAHSPLPLSSIILATSDTALLDAAQDASSTFGQDIAGALARQGEHVYLAQGRARLVQTEPTLQGFITTETSILVVYDAEEASAGQSLDTTHHEELQGTQRTGSDADFFIDERFLADSVLEDFDKQWEDDYAEEAGAAGEITAPASAASSTHLVKVIQNREVLRSSIESWKEGQRQLSIEENTEIDEESAVLLAEKGLASIGGFNGDWAIAELVGSSKPRLVRLFCYPSSASHAASQAYVPPSLLQNLQQSPADFNPFPPTPPRIRLAPIPASRSADSSTSNTPLHCPLPIPFADALTIARVPSALSSNRKYQTLFLDALKGYFEGRKRIIKEGDVIAVGVVKGKVRWIGDKGAGEEGSEKKQTEGQAERDGELADTELIDYSLPNSSSVGSEEASTSTLSAQPDGVVHFLVNSLVPELAGPSPGESSGENVRPEDLEIREHARRGLLGAVVDPILTKMVQTGIVGSRIGDWDGWLDVQSTLPDLPSPGEISPLTSPSAPFGKIVQLLEATLLPQASSYGLHLTVLLKGARGSGKKTIARWIAKQVGVHLIEINCFDILGDSDTQTEGVLRARIETASSCGPAILLLQNIDALARKSQAMETGQEPAMSHVLRSCVEKLKGTMSQGHRPVAVFGTTSDPDKCPNGILATFKHEISIDAPNEPERLQVLTTAVTQSGLILGPDVSLKEVATQTAALVAADLVDLVARARLASIERVRKAFTSLPHLLPPTEEDLGTSGICLTGADFDSALRKARSNYSESIGAPKIPNVTWDDVGGLASVKSDILDTIQLPLEHPELFTDGLKKRSGILLYGPPGTGKTLLAKAVATSCSLNFFSVKGPELLNMYIGESEANVRRVFQRARDAKPCVIFFDELDSVAPKRGNQGDSGGVMDRIVSQLLAELDGMAGGKEGTDVFVIGATNRPDLLDPALLRPGRFDRLLYLSVSETHAAQLNILKALTRKFKLDPDLGDLSIIAERCPFNLTGADFYALCSDAMLKAMTRKAGEVDEQIARLNASGPPSTASPHPYPITPQYYLSELAAPAEIEVRVKREDFEAALRELSPSVSEKEMEHYRSVQQQFSGPAKGEAGKPESPRADEGGEDAQARMLEEMMKRAELSNGSSEGGAYILDEQDDTKDEEGQQAISAVSKGKGKGKGKERARPDGFGPTHLESAGQSSSGTGELHPPLETERPQSNGSGPAMADDAIQEASSTIGREVDSSSGEARPVTNGSGQGGKGKGKGKDKGKGKARA